MNPILDPHHFDFPNERAQIAAALAKYYGELIPSKKSTPRFSLVRFFERQTHRLGLVDGYEQEICESAARMLNQEWDPHRNWVPFGALASRALSSSLGPKGGYLVGVDTFAPFDALLPWSVVGAAGVTPLSDLQNSVAIPRTATTTTAGWLTSETGPAPSETPPTLGEASLVPRTAIALIKFGLQLLKQGEAAEAFIRAQLLRAIGELLDTAFFAGTGGAQPLGLLQTPGIGTQSGTSLAYTGLLTMRQKVLTAGGREANLAWVGTPAVQELIAARELSTGSGRRCWDNDGILGKPAFATKNAPTSALTVGDFSQAVVGIFGPGVRIDIDPSQDFNSAGLVARVLLLCDVVFPQPAAFTVATSIT